MRGPRGTADDISAFWLMPEIVARGSSIPNAAFQGLLTSFPPKIGVFGLIFLIDEK
jgi:hypothetical protein